MTLFNDKLSLPSEVPTFILPTRFMILYGIQQFSNHFPFISSLFRCASASRQTSSIVESSLPSSYITLSDGSNFYAARNISFILCLPDSQVTLFF